MIRKSILTILAAMLALVSCRRDQEVRSALELTQRLIPEHAGSFRFVHTDDTSDVFSVESKGDKIVISGNNANSMAVGLNWSLKNC